MKSITSLDLSYCRSLLETQNFAMTPNLKELRLLKCEKLKEIHPSFGNLTEVEQLSLVECSALEKLPNINKEMKNIAHLELENCCSLLETPNFAMMPNLKQLRLSECKKLKEIHPSFVNLTELEELYIDGCSTLEKLPNINKEMKSITKFDLKNCCALLETPNFAMMPNLKRLRLSECEKLKEIHPSFENLTELEELCIDGCSTLEKLPNINKEMKSITHLELKNCCFLLETPNFAMMPNMEQLRLSKCEKLKEIHPCFENLTEFEKLYIDGCSTLEKLPNINKEMKSITHLKLENCCSLLETPNFAMIPNLKLLQLSECEKLKEIHPSFENLTKLEELCIDGCSTLEKLPNINKEMKSITHLELENCCSLLETPNFAMMPNLEQLRLSECEKLKEIHPSLENLTELEELCIDGCSNLEMLPNINKISPVNPKRGAYSHRHSMDFAVVTSILGIVDQHLLQQPHTSLILPADTQIIPSLRKKLCFLQSYLQESEPKTEPEAQKLLHEGIRDVAAEAEDKIESKLSDVYLAADKGDRTAVEAACEDLHHTLQQVVEDIESVEVRIRDYLQVRPTASIDDTALSTPSSLQLADIHSRDGYGLSKSYLGHEGMIGYEDELSKIGSLLIHSNPLEREVISIVGIGGAGKSNLARKVYDDPKVANKFEIRAWITVSQEFSIREVLIGIIGCIVSLTSEISEADTQCLADRLGNILKGQRYFIVINDIRTTEVWDCLQKYLPDDSKGNRILITTRILDVARHASRSYKYIFNLSILSSAESWNLFVKNLGLFKGEEFPSPELELIGEKIVEKCGRIPLAIVLIAGILHKLRISPKSWEDFAQNIDSPLTDCDSVSRIIALSYNNLPSHLRACFLYLGIFPEDSNINVKKLIKLWVAEGFLRSEMYKSLEEVAMESLCDLITRNLVLVVEWSFDGKIKSCRLHDFVRDFCLKKTQEENTLVVSSEYHSDLARTWSRSEQSKLGCRWMSCQSRHLSITQSSSLNYTSGKIRSILHFGKALYLAKCSFIFPSLKLLRVLDLSLIKCWNGVPNEVVNLIHLRYLALTTSGSLYNFQLFKLQNLQTLILFSWMEECRLQLPCDILDLPWLRHVHLDKGSSLYLPKSIQGNLQTLFWLKVVCWDAKTTPDFTRVPNLKELGIYVEGEMPADALDSLTQLYQLESLKFELGRVERFCLPISFPPNIKKLTLCNTYLPWEEMDIIAKLRNLEVLKLKDFAFCGPEWEPRSVFCRLKFLLIKHLDLKHWNASANCFPVLECLVLRYCWYLKELPSDMSDVHTLQLIQLVDCYPPLAESAQRIKRKQMVNGILDGVVVEYFSSEDVNFEEEIDEDFQKKIRKETDGGVDEKFKGFDFELFSYDNLGSDFLNVEDIDEAFPKEICKETDGEKGENYEGIFRLEFCEE